jgi:hypothetical protein
MHLSSGRKSLFFVPSDEGDGEQTVRVGAGGIGIAERIVFV